MTITPDRIRALNPVMASIAIANQAPLSKSAWRVLQIACRNGGYVAAGVGAHRGSIERIAAPTILALVRRGYLESCYASEGGVAGRLSQRSLDRLTAMTTPTPQGGKP